MSPNKSSSSLKDSISAISLNKKGFDYLSLPPELRNQVMKHALVPGDVYSENRTPLIVLNVDPILVTIFDIVYETIIYKMTYSERLITRGLWVVLLLFVFSREHVYYDTLKAERKRTIQARKRNLPGFQLLAACKQTQEEGERLFYGTNTFHLSPGPLGDILEWRQKLRPAHWKMIRSICVRFHVGDITPVIVSKIDDIRNRMDSTHRFFEHNFAINVANYVTHEVWGLKMFCLERWMKSNRDLKVTLKDMVIPGTNVNEATITWGMETDDMHTDTREMFFVLFGSIVEIGWENTRARLMKGEELAKTRLWLGVYGHDVFRGIKPPDLL